MPRINDKFKNNKPEIKEEIIRRIANGASIDSIARDKKMPCKDTIYTWRLNDDEFNDQVAVARQMSAEYAVDELLERIANCPKDRDEINRTRLWVDTVKWIACKHYPRTYGDKTQVEQTGSVDHNYNVNVKFVEPNETD